MMDGKCDRPMQILMADDNQGDVRLAIEALRDSKVKNNIFVVHDGLEAMNYLRKLEQYESAVRPDILLLDLNMPKKGGLEVLQEIKSDPELKSIPVVILTVSQAEEDIEKAYKLHANCYISKPVDLDQFIKIVKSLEDFWFTIVKLPPHE